MTINGVAAEWDRAPAGLWASDAAAADFIAYQQDYAYGEALAERGVVIRRVRLFHVGICVGLAQVQIRRLFGAFTLGLIVRGPVWLDSTLSDGVKADCYDALHATAPLEGLSGLIILPESDDAAAAAGAGMQRIMGGYHTVLWDLRPDEDALRQGLAGKWRNRLVAAEKAGLTVTPISKSPDKYAWLLNEEAQQQRTVGYRAMPLDLTPAFHRHAGKGAVIALQAKQNAETVGAMLFLRHGPCATYHIGWANEAGKQLNVHNLLLWRAVAMLKKAGVEIVDLGGVNTDFNPGIARFKIGVGGAVTSLCGAWSRGPRWRARRSPKSLHPVAA